MHNRRVIDARDVAPHITPYDRLAWSEPAVERLLASGTHRDELVAYFGPAAYGELVVLARRAAEAPRAAGEVVYILPGTMGSLLGLERGHGLPHDILWLDPIDIAMGRLRELVMRPHTPVRALGVMLYTYIGLKLRLRIAGFAPKFHPYDWRRSLGTLGRELAARIAHEGAPRVHLVGHSMGGLVARAAMALPGHERIARLVMVGTPNSGAYATIQALRGTLPVVRKLATLDLVHSAETLASEVYSSFPSLHEMLPAEGTTPIDLFDIANWPAIGPRPDADLLAAARSAQRGLAPADDRMRAIVGHSLPTVTGVRRSARDFEYVVTRAGDGTVPLSFAELPGVPTWYAREQHTDLVRHSGVIAAIIDLLRTGKTRRLDANRPTVTRAAARVSDSALRRTFRYKVDWAALSPEERRRYLENLNDPPTLALRIPAATRKALKPARSAFEIQLARGDIVDANAEAVAVGIFRGIPPAGAAAAIDRPFEGAIRDLHARRMLPGEVGRITTLPAAGRLRHAQHALVVGLGRFANLDANAIELAANGVARYAAHARLRSIATVPWGAGTGLPPTLSCAAQLRGLLKARHEGTHRLERVVFVLRDPAEFRVVERLLRSLIAELDPDGQLLRLTIAKPAARARTKAGPRAGRALAPRLAHLLVERTASEDSKETWRAAVLTAGRPAAVVSESVSFARPELEKALKPLDAEGFTSSAVPKLGRRLANLVLHENVRAALDLTHEEPLLLVHDAETSRMPWEMLTLGDWSPSIEAGLSRRFAASDLSVARFSDSRRKAKALSLLLIVNPTEDLPGAAREGVRVRDLFRRFPDAQLTIIEGQLATRSRMLAEFESGDYDVVHYAGHAAFDPEEPALSGLRASDGVVSGRDLAGLAQLPALVFFNACESGRVRRRPAERPTRALEQGASVAEAYLRAGVANYIGTYWPVGDAAAEKCAEEFYTRLIAGEALGAALLAARHALRAMRSPDWADYLHYGDPYFELKTAIAPVD